MDQAQAMRSIEHLRALEEAVNSGGQMAHWAEQVAPDERLDMLEMLATRYAFRWEELRKLRKQDAGNAVKILELTCTVKDLKHSMAVLNNAIADAGTSARVALLEAQVVKLRAFRQAVDGAYRQSVPDGGEV